MASCSCFQMFISKEKGRGLRANRSIQPGTLLMKHNPFVYVLSKAQKGIRCDHCFKKQEVLLRCSQCKYMRYCNKSCQKGSWSQHKKECEALKRVAPKTPPDFVILLSRVLWKLENSMDNDRPEDLVSIMDLESNYSRLTDDQKENLGQFVIILHSYWGQGTLPLQTPDIKAVLELCAKLKNNCFAIGDEEMRMDIGCGIYLNCSLLNHDCAPNCVAVFDNLELSIRVLRDVQAGEELTISYTDQLAPSFDRQEDLRSIYAFTCKCKRCREIVTDRKMTLNCNPKNSEKMYLENGSQQLAIVKAIVLELDKVSKTGDYKLVHEITEDYIKRQVLPFENVYMTKILDYAMDACINTQNYKKAILYGRKSISTYQKFLCPNHPLIGLQAMRLGKLLLYTNQISLARDWLLQAVDILYITHKEKGLVLTELSELIKQCSAEMVASQSTNS